jgi:hypothetical protein
LEQGLASTQRWGTSAKWGPAKMLNTNGFGVLGDGFPATIVHTW